MEKQQPCCQKMKNQLEHVCEQHPSKINCPDCVVIKTRYGFSLPIKDGGDSGYTIYFCPWCGKSLKVENLNPEKDIHADDITTGDDITDFQDLEPHEIKRMQSTGDCVRCPDCNTALNEGPSGGSSINLLCPQCNVVFNWCMGAWCQVVRGKRKLRDPVIPVTTPSAGFFSIIKKMFGANKKVDNT